MLIVTGRDSGRSVSALSDLDKGLMAEINPSEMGKSTNCMSHSKAHFTRSVYRKTSPATVYSVIKRFKSIIFHFFNRRDEFIDVNLL